MKNTVPSIIGQLALVAIIALSGIYGLKIVFESRANVFVNWDNGKGSIQILQPDKYQLEIGLRSPNTIIYPDKRLRQDSRKLLTPSK